MKASLKRNRLEEGQGQVEEEQLAVVQGTYIYYISLFLFTACLYNTGISAPNFFHFGTKLPVCFVLSLLHPSFLAAIKEISSKLIFSTFYRLKLAKMGFIYILKSDRLKKIQNKLHDCYWWNIQKLFHFSPAYSLIMWLMRSSKNFEKVAILQIWEMVSFRGGKTHFGKTPLKLCIFRHDFFCFLSIWLSDSYCPYKM